MYLNVNLKIFLLYKLFIYHVCRIPDKVTTLHTNKCLYLKVKIKIYLYHFATIQNIINVFYIMSYSVFLKLKLSRIYVAIQLYTYNYTLFSTIFETVGIYLSSDTAQRNASYWSKETKIMRKSREKEKLFFKICYSKSSSKFRIYSYPQLQPLQSTTKLIKVKQF